MPLLTIVFTDVVESSATKGDVSLGRDTGERDRAYLEGIQTRHFSLIRECCRSHGGHEVSTMGDSFCLTFDLPVEAVRCAADIQKRLATAPIETPRGPLRLRIGIHSGFPEPFEGGWQARMWTPPRVWRRPPRSAKSCCRRAPTNSFAK